MALPLQLVVVCLEQRGEKRKNYKCVQEGGIPKTLINIFVGETTRQTLYFLFLFWLKQKKNKGLETVNKNCQRKKRHESHF